MTNDERNPYLKTETNLVLILSTKKFFNLLHVYINKNIINIFQFFKTLIDFSI